MQNRLPVRRFAKGDKVLAPCISHRLPLAEVLEVYEGVNGQQVLSVAYVECPQRQTFCRAENVDYIGERKYIAFDTGIWRVSNIELVAESQNWAPLIAEFLETSTPPFPGEAEADSAVAHDAWRALNE